MNDRYRDMMSDEARAEEDLVLFISNVAGCIILFLLFLTLMIGLSIVLDWLP